MNKQNIEQKANYLLQSLKYNDGEVDVLTIAQTLGFVVGIAALPSNDNGFILIDHSKKQIYRIIALPIDKAIGVNVHLDLQTRRFIIAHEIGHYILHYHSNPFIRREFIYQVSREEIEADFFASCLLMPQKPFIRRYNELKDKDLSKEDIITLLQKSFNVPEEKVKQRIINTFYAEQHHSKKS